MAARGGTTGTAADSSGRTDDREALRTLSDKPLEGDAGDRLDFIAYADALAGLLDHPDTDTPLTIAISAQWGAGKTSLAKMVENRLWWWPIQRGDPQHITCWFNAWMHDDAPYLGAAFAAEVAKTADRYRPRWRRLISPLASAMLSPQERWRRRLRIAAASFVFAIGITLLPGPGRIMGQAFAPKTDILDRLQELLGSTHVGAAILVLATVAFWRKVFGIAQAAARFVDDPKSEAAKGSMQNVSTQLGQLIEQATHVRRQWLVLPRLPRRFVIFVDDLERCRPPRAVEVCEVASQLLGHRNVATVLIADMATIAASAEIKYAEHIRAVDTKNSSVPGLYGRLYLQKIVQIQFNLPPSPVEGMPELLGESERVEYPLNLWRRISPKAQPALGVLLALLALGFLSSRASPGFPLAEVPRRYTPGGSPDPSSGSLPSWWSSLIFYAILLVPIGWVVWKIFRDYQTYRTHQAQRLIDQEIRRAVTLGATTVDEVMERLVSQGLEPKRRKLAQQRAQRMLTDDSARRMQAESEIKQYLPALPRSAKRLFNHLRVLFVVAEQRHMFGGQPDLQAKHLGKWACS